MRKDLDPSQLGPTQIKFIDNVLASGSGCSAHHRDLGLVADPQEEHQTHEAARRLAISLGLYEPEHWIGQLTLFILQNFQKPEDTA